MASPTTQPEQEVDLEDLVEGEVESHKGWRPLVERFLDVYVLAPARVASADWRALVGTTIIIAYIFMGTIGVIIVPKPTLGTTEPYLDWFVNWNYPLGSDNLGKPIHGSVVHATPAMLKMALSGAATVTVVATAIGTASGFKGGNVDRVLMMLTDIVLTIPGLPLIILIAAIWMPRDPFLVGFILAIDNWPGLARNIRSQVLSIRESTYVEVDRIMGITTPRILLNDVARPIMPYVFINSANAARGVIFESVGLYFLGLLPFARFNWGVMMNNARQQGAALSNLSQAGHWLFAPMIVLAVFSFGLIIFAQGMDSVFNPRLRAKFEETTADDPSGEVPE